MGDQGHKTVDKMIEICAEKAATVYTDQLEIDEEADEYESDNSQGDNNGIDQEGIEDSGEVVCEDEMEERGITQKQLAELLGVSPSRISEYMTGKSEPTLKVARLMRDKLDIDADFLLG